VKEQEKSTYEMHYLGECEQARKKDTDKKVGDKIDFLSRRLRNCCFDNTIDISMITTHPV